MKLTDFSRKPNVVIVITDQEREAMHWPEGWAETNLPARRRLMENGLHFKRAQCNTAACSSSRATFLTGLYPAQHGVKNLVNCGSPKDNALRRTPFLSSRLPNLATVMAAAGYHVVLKGKLHVTRPVTYDREMKRHYWSAADTAHLAERYGFHGWNPPDMSDPQSLNDLGGGTINNDGRFVDGSGTAAGHPASRDQLFRESAVHFLNTYDGDKPFCLIVALVNPHDVQEFPGRGVRGLSMSPTFAQGGYRLEDFVDLPIDLPPTIDDDLSTKPGVQSSFRKLLAAGTGHVLSRERQLAYVRFYAYLNQQVDAQILKVLDALDANGLTDDTLILRTSDHGELGLSHGRMRQKFYNAYRETLSIPLIVSNPRLYPRPQSTDAFASLIDVVPTLAALAGTPEPQQYGFKGHDLTPILSDPKATVQDVLHFTYEDDVFPVKGADCIRAIVEPGWKYAVYYDPFTGAPTEYEMYDLARDPLELTNLAHATHSTPASEIERARLHQRLIDVMQQNGTTPDEIQWPTADEFRPSASFATASEHEDDDTAGSGPAEETTMTPNVKNPIRSLMTSLALAAMVCMAAPAQAQLNGENLLGDMGVKSGTQPEPGWYVSTIYYRYRTKTIKDAQGRSIDADPTGEGNQTINAGVPLLYWVTPKKVLGGQFAMMAVLPVASGALEAPGLGLSEEASLGLSDLYVMPAQLGWHFTRADALLGAAFFAPTGRYTAGASDNLGKGMWSYEISGGGTVYLDQKRSFSVSATAFWETHSKKEGEVRVENITISDVRVGDLITVEGGIGKSFLHGAASVGMAYYAQWKVTSDDLGLVSVPHLSGIPERHRVWGIGPDVTIPIATKTRLLSLVNVRYLWEQGARLKTQGQTLMITNTIPVGGIKIPGRS